MMDDKAKVRPSRAQSEDSMTSEMQTPQKGGAANAVDDVVIISAESLMSGQAHVKLIGGQKKGCPKLPNRYIYEMK